MKPPQANRPPPIHVSLPAAPRPHRGPGQDVCRHDRVLPDRLSGTLHLTLTTVDSLHIGSGMPALLELSRGPRVIRSLVLCGAEKVPVIPGASLKGAVRNLAEAIAGGCDLSGPCVPPCVTCALFGLADPRAGGLAARAGFSDALPVDEEAALDAIGVAELPVAFAPRQRGGRRIYKTPRATLPGAVPYEVIVRGVSFASTLRFMNVSQAELGLVALCLGLDGSFLLRIGGGKYAGLGRVRCALTGGLLRRGYRQPAPEQLDAAGAAALARQAIAAYQPDPRGQAMLEQVRAVLGEGTS